MIDNRYRRQRLLKILPEVFAQTAEDSVLSTVINSMANTLAEVDSALVRIQRDHWFAFANGEAVSDEALSALERLGDLLGIVRLQDEASENYRQRLELTAKILLRGLTTPRSILELAIVTLGAEPCLKQSTEKDAILAIGLPLGTRKKCTQCHNPQAVCPNKAQQVLTISLTENPPQQLQFKSNGALATGAHFSVMSDSLTEDVPQVHLQALNQAIHYPILQNIATGEMMLFAGVINVGEVLSIWPEVTEAEDVQFDSFSEVDAHNWQTHYRSGSAVLVNVQGQARTVNQSIYYLAGKTFPAKDVAIDDPKAPRFADNQAREGTRFADALSAGDSFDSKAAFANDTAQTGAKFGGSSQIVRTPRIIAGTNEWLYNTYNKQDIAAIAGEQVGDLFNNAPDDKPNAPALLTLSWWSRPPATFHLRIARNAWVRQAEQRGATHLFSRWLQQVKAAGVRALLDYPEEPLREIQFNDNKLDLQTQQTWQDTHLLTEQALTWQVAQELKESHALNEGAPIWSGVFDRTRLDSSSFHA
ncbi:MAG: hypothetical protein WAX77_03895 [Methylococcaceae bacterium]